MRADDRAEILCQCPPGTSASEAAAACWHGTQDGWRWIARYRGEPVMAFGLMAYTWPLWLGWAFGTNRMWRGMKAAGAHILARREAILAAGCRRIEVRALKQSGLAALWIRHLGGKFVCDLPDCGSGGETFELWEWTASNVSTERAKDTKARPGPDAGRRLADCRADPQAA